MKKVIKQGKPIPKKGKIADDLDELKKPAKLKPIKSKEPKRSKNPSVFEEDDDILEEDIKGFDSFDHDEDDHHHEDYDDDF